ncbi:hypothetical protein [Methanoregula sp.]|uniref:hypothetical protein n=1 Tax=Methanoregula sp. TaxID=2052170 RepID=UPI00356B545F
MTTVATLPATGTVITQASAIPTSALPSLTSGIAAAPLPAVQPETNHSMAAPVGGTGSGSLFLPVIAGMTGIIIVVIGGIFLRRWWIRKQNMALFRKYD